MAQPYLLISYKAREDLKEIGRYTLKKWGREQRDKYLGAIFSSFDRLASDELLTVDSSDVREGYRKCYIGRHIVFFRRIGDRIEIVDIASHLP